jgi:hypothetical protein
MANEAGAVSINGVGSKYLQFDLAADDRQYGGNADPASAYPGRVIASIAMLNLCPCAKGVPHILRSHCRARFADRRGLQSPHRNFST